MKTTSRLYWDGEQNSTGAASTGPIWNQDLDFAIRRPAQGTLEFGVVAEIPGSYIDIDQDDDDDEDIEP